MPSHMMMAVPEVTYQADGSDDGNGNEQTDHTKAMNNSQSSHAEKMTGGVNNYRPADAVENLQPEESPEDHGGAAEQNGGDQPGPIQVLENKNAPVAVMIQVFIHDLSGFGVMIPQKRQGLNKLHATPAAEAEIKQMTGKGTACSGNNYPGGFHQAGSGQGRSYEKNSFTLNECPDKYSPVAVLLNKLLCPLH